MTRISQSIKEKTDLLFKSNSYSAIKKYIPQFSKEYMVFEKIQEEDDFSLSINEEEQTFIQSKQIQCIFKKPIDKSRIRKINTLAEQLGQIFNELKESTPIKRRRKITIYGL